MSGLLNAHRRAVAGGGGEEAETTSLVARMTTPPDSTRRALINTLISTMKTDGVWSKLDAFVVFAAADAQAAKLNWISGSFDPTTVSSPTFTVDRGYNGNDTGYLNANYNPATNGSDYVLNSAYVGAWSRTANNDANGGCLVGVATSFGQIDLRGRSQGDARATLNSNTLIFYNGSPDGSGWFAVNRTSSTDLKLYRNTVEVASGSITSTAVPSANVYVGAMNFLGSAAAIATQEIAVYAIGGGFTATDHNNLYAAVEAYLVAVGAA